MVYPNYAWNRYGAQAGRRPYGYGAHQHGYGYGSHGYRPGAYGWGGSYGRTGWTGRYFGQNNRYSWPGYSNYRRNWLWRRGGYGYGPQSHGYGGQPYQQQGAMSPWVAWAQSCLSQVVGAQIQPTGIMNRHTRYAIRRFQAQQQLPATGMLDAATVNALQAACTGAQATPTPQPIPAPAAPAPAIAVPPAGDDAAAASAAAAMGTPADAGAPPADGPPADAAVPDGGAAPPDASAGELEFRRRRRFGGWGGGFGYQQPDQDDDSDGIDNGGYGGYGRGRRRGWMGRRSRGWRHEMETTTNSALLSFKIPESPYSDETFKWIHKGLDLFEALHATVEIFGPSLLELLGAAGLGITAAAPLVAMVGSWFALGAGYMEAENEISRRRVRWGFTLGVVLGADARTWGYVKQRYWRAQPERNDFDPHAGVVAQNAFNIGLTAGFLQGKQVSENPAKKEFFWRSIGRQLTQGDMTQFGGGVKSERGWSDWYSNAAGIFNRLYLKDDTDA